MCFLINAFLFQCFILMVSTGTAANQSLLEDGDDDQTIDGSIGELKEQLDDCIDSVFGGECVKDEHCAPWLAFCDTNEGFTGNLGIAGECRPIIWAWVIIDSLLLFLITVCIFCICCAVSSPASLTDAEASAERKDTQL
eukprot:GFUD01010849.1.p1 GENE.GFUD01010849.1~~GFUD01010849.1.p1  ORF type:complete len:139 (-),score=26.24 GFUD01010849.1:117-533(-)